MLQVERWEIQSVVNGWIRLDGGAMFGVVPRVLWEKKAPPDSLNRIRLATRTLLAVNRTAGRVVLVDSGCGTKWSATKAERFSIEYDPDAIPRALAASGLRVDDVTDVVVTHLHFDHNGGLTSWVAQEGGETRLIYSGARHWIHKGHWDHARAPHPKDRASFVPEDFAALEKPGALCFVEGDQPDPPVDGLSWFVSGGHTPFQLHPVFGSEADALLFVGDIVPTAAHLPLGWVMAYDMEPIRTIAEKQAIYRRCRDQGLKLAFPHDPEIAGVLISGAADRPEPEAVLNL